MLKSESIALTWSAWFSSSTPQLSKPIGKFAQDPTFWLKTFLNISRNKRLALTLQISQKHKENNSLSYWKITLEIRVYCCWRFFKEIQKFAQMHWTAFTTWSLTSRARRWSTQQNQFIFRSYLSQQNPHTFQNLT